MTEEHIQRIERELSIQLPQPYRDVMLHFPVPACVGNNDQYLWDNAEQLIDENRYFRQEFRWPEHFFVLGSRESHDCDYVMDLRRPEGPVWWADRDQLSHELSPSFADWSRDYFKDLRHDLDCDGIDPDGTPEDRRQLEGENFQVEWRFMINFFLAAGIVAVLILGAMAYIKWLM